MSITVREVMKMGCLVHAKLLAGAGGLEKEIKAHEPHFRQAGGSSRARVLSHP